MSVTQNRIINTVGYWNFVGGALIILFIFYITAKGELRAWINILTWQPGATPTVANNTAVKSSSNSVQGALGSIGSTVQGAATSAVNSTISNATTSATNSVTNSIGSAISGL